MHNMPAETYFCVLQRLQEEAQWLLVVEYVRALMQKRLVCRSAEERSQLAQQMVQDDQQFREIFHGLVRRIWLCHSTEKFIYALEFFTVS